MSRTMRWILVVLGAVVVFGGCFWLGRWDPFHWVPDEDGVEIAGAFAGAMTAIALAAGSAWALAGPPAAPPTPPTPPAPAPLAPPAPPAPAAPAARSAKQKARASKKSKVTQTITGTAPDRSVQNARTSGEATVEQQLGDPPAPGAGTAAPGGTGPTT
ncbi:hypothetical protein [Streptomyces sp. NBC_01408]|uniref:hypothetical protein n=1 Tax=Streptomyces sp. NBC_01408 TaxID=2903855 RepID=UPI00225C23E4|nr:hypothetical protein [Streptomyces sp. NBC_01408]MCX4691769.1 hypothetical protein [Streptomyces sp. NBC_01408]